MGKIRDLDIRYDHPSAYAGSLLRGQVCFCLKECLKLRDFSLWIEGQTKLTLTGDSCHEKWLMKYELNFNQYLAQYDYRLNPGFHQIPFAYPISHTMPSSFGDKLGYVYYCSRITINGQSKLHKVFTVIGIEDLNWHPYAALPVNLKECAQAPFWAFSKSSYNVTVLLQLERTGYIAGEAVYVNAEIMNQSKRKVKQSSLQLKQGILYKSPSGRQKEVSKIVETVTRGSIPPGSMDHWENEPLIVPNVAPSFLRGSEFVSLKYELVFTVEPGLTMVIPIIIGTIPFHPENLKRIMKALPWKECSDVVKRRYSTRQQNVHFDDNYDDKDYYYNSVSEQQQSIKIEEID